MSELQANDVIIYENGIAQVPQETIAYIKKLEETSKAIKAKQDEMKQELMKQMEKYGVTQIKNDCFTISYTPEHTAERFDSKELQNQSPALYEAYCKEATVKASLRITLKK